MNADLYSDVYGQADLRTPGQHAAYAELNALVAHVYRLPIGPLIEIEIDGKVIDLRACDPLTAEDADWGEHDDLANVPRKTRSMYEFREGDVEEAIIKAAGKHALIPLAVSECRIAPNLMEQLKSRDKTKGRLRILDQTETTILTFIRGAPVLVIDDGSLPYNMIVVDSMRSRR